MVNEAIYQYLNSNIEIHKLWELKQKTIQEIDLNSNIEIHK